MDDVIFGRPLTNTETLAHVSGTVSIRDFVLYCMYRVPTYFLDETVIHFDTERQNLTDRSTLRWIE